MSSASRPDIVAASDTQYVTPDYTSARHDNRSIKQPDVEEDRCCGKQLAPTAAQKADSCCGRASEDDFKGCCNDCEDQRSADSCCSDRDDQKSEDGCCSDCDDQKSENSCCSDCDDQKGEDGCCSDCVVEDEKGSCCSDCGEEPTDEQKEKDGEHMIFLLGDCAAHICLTDSFCMCCIKVLINESPLDDSRSFSKSCRLILQNLLTDS